MARSRPSTGPQPEPPQVSPLQGIQLVESLVGRANALLEKRPITSDDHSSWELLAENLLAKAFGRNSPNIASVVEVGKWGSFPMNAGEAWWENHRATTLRSQVRQMEGLKELLQTEVQLSGGQAVKASPDARGHRIFLVHGHDDRALHETARYLEKLRQDVIILREQPNQGRTIIEKFEDYADVGFAVVLLTGDDRGGPVSVATDSLKLRARQNVVFELGYFIGRLGRNRVCALYVDGVELPSDYSGVLYTKLDASGAWRLELAKELKAAGLPVDMNDAV